jgi:hypothetical protein
LTFASGSLLADVVATLKCDVGDLSADQLSAGEGDDGLRGGTVCGFAVQQHLVGQRKHRVAGQHRGRITLQCPHGGAMVTLSVAVHQVVVHQREVVD